VITIGFCTAWGSLRIPPFFYLFGVIKRQRLSSTPAPKSERISGSKTNARYSASSSKSASSIRFTEATTSKIRKKLAEYNRANPKQKISLATAKAVVRRGMGAYSSTHRPTISGGKPNSRTAWGLARLHAFMRLKSKSDTANGVVRKSPIRKTYQQDNDLL